MDKGELVSYAALKKAQDEADRKNLAAWEKRGLTAIKYSDAELKKFADVGAKPVWNAWVKENAAKGVPAQELLDLVLKEAEIAKKKLGKS